MSNILPFGKEAKERWATGVAICMACKHEEVTVAPVGITDLECSACGAMKSHWKYEFRPEGLIRTCNCGNDLFYMTPEGHFCPNCGNYQRYK